MTVSPIGEQHFVSRSLPALKAFALLRAGWFKMVTVQIRQPKTVVDAPTAPGRPGLIDGGRINDSVTIAPGPLRLLAALLDLLKHIRGKFLQKSFTAP